MDDETLFDNNIVTLATYSCDVTRFSGSARDLSDKRAVLFSYGSGFASSMFSVRMSRDCGADSSLQALVASVADLKQRLNSRRKISPEQFAQTMRLREETHHIGSIKRSDLIEPYQNLLLRVSFVKQLTSRWLFLNI